MKNCFQGQDRNVKRGFAEDVGKGIIHCTKILTAIFVAS